MCGSWSNDHEETNTHIYRTVRLYILQQKIYPDDGGGQSVKGANPTQVLVTSQTKTTPTCTGRGKRGYWLGMKANLKHGEAPRRLNKTTKGENKCSMKSLNTKAKGVRGLESNLGPEKETILQHNQSTD